MPDYQVYLAGPSGVLEIIVTADSAPSISSTSYVTEVGSSLFKTSQIIAIVPVTSFKGRTSSGIPSAN